VGRGATQRFARERAILASLNHPNIARLLDAGLARIMRWPVVRLLRVTWRRGSRGTARR
jgi:hypothetical protein